jgi:hypothetical protein
VGVLHLCSICFRTSLLGRRNVQPAHALETCLLGAGCAPDLRQVAGIALFPLLVGASGGGVDGMRLHLLAGHASDAGAFVEH